MNYYPNVGEWVRAYAGKLNHLVVGFQEKDGFGFSGLIFACGKTAVFSQYGYDAHKDKCQKCNLNDSNVPNLTILAAYREKGQPHA